MADEDRPVTPYFKLFLIVLGFACMFYVYETHAGPLDETRYCGTPIRDASGAIYRSSTVRASFIKIHPCPVTGKPSGACPGWQVNHVIPLACGGCDSVSNMDWMPVEIKTCTQPYCRDRFERKIYGGLVPGTSCTIPPLK